MEAIWYNMGYIAMKESDFRGRKGGRWKCFAGIVVQRYQKGEAFVAVAGLR
jgi:hypothetical protein